MEVLNVLWLTRSYGRAGVGDGGEMGLGEGEVQFLPISGLVISNRV